MCKFPAAIVWIASVAAIASNPKMSPPVNAQNTGTKAGEEAINTLSRNEKADGWKLLFNGKSTDG